MIRRLCRGPLARSSVGTGALLGLRMLTQVVILLLLTRLFGPEIYGKIAAATALVIVLGILANLGAGYVMMARAPEGDDAVAQVWRYAWPSTLAAGAVLLGLYVPLAFAAGGSSALPWWILFGIGVSELLFTPFSALLSFALQARQKVPLSQLVLLLPMILRILAVSACFVLPITQRLQGYVLLQIVASAIGVAIGLAITARQVELKWRPRLATVAELRRGSTYSAMHVVAANPSEIDKILAPRLVGTYDAGIYAAATRVMGATVMPVIAMLLSAQPRLFHNAHLPSQPGYRLIKVIAALALSWGLLSWLVLTLCSPLLPWLFGTQFNDMVALMPVLAMVAAPLSLRLAAGAILVALGRPLERVAFELFGVGLLIVLMPLLASAMGIKGMAISLFVSELTMAVAGWWLVQKKLAVTRA